MNTKDYIDETGKIKTFHLEEEVENLLKIPKTKPSSRIINSKKGRRALAGLIDIEQNRNHTWWEEICKRAEKDPNALALFYRGTKITFKEMIDRSMAVAKSLSQMGIKPGDTIPACLSNTPELVYILGAVNILGAKINLMSTTLEEDYIREILPNCSNKVFLATDDQYGKIEHIIKDSQFDHVVINSLADSLPEDPTKCDEYEPSLDKYYHYDNYVPQFQERDNRVVDFKTFSEYGNSIDMNLEPVGDLNTEFLITYTSGSTKIGRPKQIVHTNRSLIVSGRFHDSELSGNPDLKGLRGLAHIHSDSNTDIITCISDNLMQLWSVGLEPEYSRETALDSIFLNKPNYMNATTSFLLYAFKEYLIDKRFHENGVGRKMPWLFACFAVGEGVSPGEEKFLNKGLREARAGSGVKIKGFSLPFTTLCVGGGDCEHGGIYYTLWKALYDKINYFKLKKHITGLIPEAYVQVSAFKPNEDGTYTECEVGEYGLIASNSATTMSHYANNPEKTKELIITDEYGRDFVSNNVYGYIDELGGVHVKGRYEYKVFLGEFEVYPYQIEDVINVDTKNILSCAVCKTANNETVVNLEFQPDKKIDPNKVIKSIIDRFKSIYNIDISNLIAFRVFDHKTGLPLTGSGKRSIKALEQLGLKDTFMFNSMTNSIYPINVPEEPDNNVNNVQKVL